ncbi:hypothetical protein BN1723_019955, partial [Verticillium longisporum]
AKVRAQVRPGEHCRDPQG